MSIVFTLLKEVTHVLIHEPLGDVLNCPQTVANATLQQVSFSKYKPHITLSKGIHESNHFFLVKVWSTFYVLLTVPGEM